MLCENILFVYFIRWVGLYSSQGYAGEKGLSGDRGIPGTLVRVLTLI